MAITSSGEVNLSTALDEYAAELFISSKPGESLSAFNERIIAGQENLFMTGPEAFINSLDYITTRRTKEICELSIVTEEGAELTDYSIEATHNKIIIKKNGIVYEELSYEDYKFVCQLIDRLSELSFMDIALKEGYESVKFEKSKNILNTSNKKKYVSFQSSEELIELPVQNVIRVLNQRNMDSLLPFEDETQTKIINSSKELLNMSIEYIENPIKLKWNHFDVVECNSDYFKSMLKDSNGFLTSQGANLLNQILKKQNTYWGE